MTPAQIAELRRVAEGATPGPWFHVQPFQIAPTMRTIHGTVPAQRVDFVAREMKPVHSRPIVPMEGRENTALSCDMAFIAAANPATILSLLAERDALVRVAEAAKKLTDEFGGSLEMLQRHGPDYTFKSGERVLVASVLEDREEIVEEARSALAALAAIQEKSDAMS